MTVKYDATYKIGNTTVNIVAPKNQTEEEKEKVLDEFHAVGWSIWNSLTDEQKKETNNELKA